MKGDRRPTGVKWEYNGDGRYPHDRIKGEDKRQLRRLRRRQGKITE